MEKERSLAGDSLTEAAASWPPWGSRSTLQVSEEAEAAVLATVLIDPSFWPKVEGSLDAQDFALERNRLIFESMAEVVEAGQEVDRLTVQAQLEENGNLERVGGVAYLACLDVFLPDPGRVEAYIQIVQDRSTRRNLSQLATRLAQVAVEEGRSAREAVEWAQGAIHKVAERAIPVPLQSLGEVADSTVVALEEGQPHTALRFGLPDLDDLTSGLVGGHLIVVAGRPGSGKTSLGLSIVRDLVLRQGCRTVLFSLEMSGEEIAMRLLSAEATIPYQRLASGILSHSQWSRIHAFAQVSRNSPLHICDRARLTPSDVSSTVRQTTWKHGTVQAVVIDYLQLMRSGQREPNENLELATIVQCLKELAREVEIPIILLSQLSREPERRGPGTRPKLSDLRGSGSIEQAADLVIFPWERDEAFDTDANVDLIVAKHRNGPTGEVPVVFRKDLMAFEPLEASIQGRHSDV